MNRQTRTNTQTRGSALLVFAATTVLASTSRGQVTRPDFRASVETVEGEELKGRLAWIVEGAGVKVRLSPLDERGSARVFELDDLDSIQIGHGWSVRAQGARYVELRNGDRFMQAMTSLDGERVGLSSGWSFDRRRLRLSVFRPEAEGLEERLELAAENPPTTDDLLFAIGRSGQLQQLTVEAIGLSDGQLSVRFGDQTRSLPIDRCAALVFGEDRGLAAEEPERPHVRVHMTNGTTITGRVDVSADQTGGTLKLLAEGAEPISVPLVEVAWIQVASSRVLWLHDRDPIEVERQPAFDRLPEWSRGRTELGVGLRLGGVRYDRGFALRPFTRLSFAVPEGRFDRFEATLGIDDRSRGPAIAILRIRVGDEIAGEWTVEAGEPGLPISVPLGPDTGKVALEADFGPMLDLGDHCVVAEPRLKRDS